MKGVIFVFLVLINEVHIVIPVGVAEQVSVRLEMITDVAFLPDIERFRALVFADEALTTEKFECRGSSYASKIFRTGICPFVKFCRADTYFSGSGCGNEEVLIKGKFVFVVCVFRIF